MCYSFTEKMDNVIDMLNTEKDKASQQPTVGEVEKQGVGSGKKRPAPEILEHGLTKVAKTAAAGHDDCTVTEEAQQVQDPRDEKIATLITKLRKAKNDLAKLEVALEEVQDELYDRRCRVHELEAREEKRIEKETAVETGMLATMRLAAKNMDAEGKARIARKEKELKEKFKLDKEDYAEKHDARLEKKLDEAAVKAQRNQKLLQDKLSKAKDDHKDEMHALKECQKEALKNLRPEHSQAMKDKAKELKAKDKEIDNLRRTVEAMEAVEAENEKLEGAVKAQETKNAGLRDYMKKEQAKWKTMQAEWKAKEDRYKSKLEHEGRRWELQSNSAVQANNKLVVVHQANFALRADRDAKDNRVHELEGKLQAACEEENALGKRMLQQRVNLDRSAGRGVEEDQVRTFDDEPQVAQEQSVSSARKSCFQRSIDINEPGTPEVDGVGGETSTTDLPSAPTSPSIEGETNDTGDANGVLERAE